MNCKKPTYEELERKLVEAEEFIDRLLSGNGHDLPINALELQKAYIESEQNFRNSLDMCPLGIRIITKDGNLLYANKAILDIFGYHDIEELKAVPMKRLYTSQSYIDHRERVEKRQCGEYVPRCYETIISREDGDVRYLQVFREEVIWGGEKQFMSMYQDITDRRKAEEALQESKELFEKTFTNQNVAILVLESGYPPKIRECNPATTEIFGYTREEMLGQTTALLHVDDDSIYKFGQLLHKQIENNELSKPFEYTLRRKDGTIFSSEHTVAQLKDINGVRVGWVTIIRDVTERKQAEEALRNSENVKNAVMNASPDAIAVVDENSILFDLNEAMAKRFGKQKEEILGTKCGNLIPPGLAEIRREQIRGVFKTGQSVFFEDDNHGVCLENIVFPILKEEGKVTRVAINSRDITERKKAEEALRKSEEKFSKAFRSSPHRIAIAALEDGRFIEVNDSFLQITGYTREEVIGHTSIELNFWVDIEDRVRIIRNLKEKGHVFNNEVLMRPKSGEIHTLLFSGEPITINGEPCMISVSTDITERKQNEEKFQTILKTAIDGFWIHNLEGRIIEVNDSYCNMTGYTREELLEMSISDIEVIESPDDTRRHIEKIVREGSDFFETRHRRKNGSTIDVEISVNYPGVSDKQMFVFARDITERKKARKALQESQEKLMRIFESMSDGIVVTELNGLITDVNEAMLKLGGLTSKDTVIGRSGLEYLVPQDLERALVDMKELAQSGAATAGEFSLLKADGSSYPAEISVNVLKDIENNVVGFVSIIRDVTERKRVENALRESEERYRTLVDTAGDAGQGIIVIQNTEDQEAAIVFANPRLHRILGYSLEDLMGKPVWNFISPVSLAMIQERYRKRQQGEDVINTYEAIAQHKDGMQLPVELSAGIITYEGKIATVAYIRDITERKNAEISLRESEEKYRLLADNARDIIYRFQVSPDNKFEYVSPSIVDITGYTPEEHYADPYIALNMVHPEDLHYMATISESPEFIERPLVYRWITKTGKSIWIEHLRRIIYDDSGKIVAIEGIARDITERKRDEERIQNLNQTLRSIRNVAQLINREKEPEALIQGICNIMVEGQIFNSVWIALLDKSGIPTIYAEAGLGDYFTPFNEMFKRGELTPCARKAIKREEVVLTEHHPTMCMDCPIRKESDSIEGIAVRLGHEDNIYGIMCASAPSYILSDEELVTLFNQVAADISFALYNIELEAEHELLEQERLRSAKLESISTLAGGIAHDFNNLLTGIMGNIGLAKMYLKPSGKDFETLDEAEKAAVRAKDLTQQLLTFARGGMPIKKSVTIGELIEESTRFALRGSSTSPILSLPDDLWLVEVDEGQMSQVIHNIVINADEAMPGGGKLEITASNITLRKTSPLPLPKGKYIRIDIKDTGMGISKEHLQRIFEPYFTTKQKGSGLGLSTAYSIIKNHGGYITVESTQNKGTIFRVYLSASDKPLEVDEETASVKTSPRGGRILVMDDEDIIRNMLSNMLQIAGYEAELTVDGVQALDMYNEALETGKPFDAVIMDLTIPGGMGGKEAIKKLRVMDPQAKVIVSSGYATDPIMADFQDYGFDAVITKPYSINQLENVLHQLFKQ